MAKNWPLAKTEYARSYSGIATLIATSNCGLHPDQILTLREGSARPTARAVPGAAALCGKGDLAPISAAHPAATEGFDSELR